MGKIFTIAGIVLVFGYFIMESLRDPSDPTAVVMVGNDTLGRDWGAMADQREAALNAEKKEEGEEDLESSSSDKPLINDKQDPYQRAKLNSTDYTTIESADGREIITGYDRPEEQNDPYNYESRRQKEQGQSQYSSGSSEEPSIKYKD